MHPAPTPSIPRGIALIVVGFGICSLMDLAAKWLVQTVPIPQIVFFRYGVHMLVLLALFNVRVPIVARSGRLRLQVVRSALLLASTAIFFVALRYLPVANATAIAFLSPLIVTALSVPLLGERVGPRRWAAVLVGFLGVLVVVRPGFGLQWPALLPALVATCLGLYQIATRVLARVDDTSTTIFHTAVVGTVASLIAIPFYWQAPTLPELALLILLGSLGAAGHMLIVHAYRYAGASVLSPFIYTQLVWATAGGYLIFDQFPDPVTLVGATLIIGSGLYVYLRERALLVAARQSG